MAPALTPFPAAITNRLAELRSAPRATSLVAARAVEAEAKKLVEAAQVELSADQKALQAATAAYENAFSLSARFRGHFLIPTAASKYRSTNVVPFEEEVEADQAKSAEVAGVYEALKEVADSMDPLVIEQRRQEAEAAAVAAAAEQERLRVSCMTGVATSGCGSAAPAWATTANW